MKAKDRLVEAMQEDMDRLYTQQASLQNAIKDGAFDDFNSEYPFPKRALEQRFALMGLNGLAARVAGGEFAEGPEEFEDWWKEHGQKAYEDAARQAGIDLNSKPALMNFIEEYRSLPDPDEDEGENE